MRTKVPQAYTRAKHPKLVSGLENSKSEASSDIQESAQTCTTDTSWNGDEWNDGWSLDGTTTGVPLDGTKVGNNRMTLPQAHFHLDVWMSVPPVVRSVFFGENEAGHRNCSERIPIDLWSRRSRRWKILSDLPVVNGFLMMELGNSKDTTKTDCSDL